MILKLEQLEYQQKAINSVIKVFEGQERNTFENAGSDGIRSNILTLTKDELLTNIKKVTEENGISLEAGKLSQENDLCIEMETGTGKTLVYLKTIYELYARYGFTKFIILVPTVPIREGILSTFEAFHKQLDDLYGFTPNLFEYDSKRLSKVKSYIEEQHPQIMVMTLQSFNSEDKILNQAEREDLFANLAYIDAIGATNPFIIMDEPQEGMDTDNSIERIKKLNPIYKLRYSATHKVMRNLIYRLTPFESYKQGLVKKIEVLTVTEKNDEASMKVEIDRIDTSKDIKVKLKAWHLTASGYKFKGTKLLGKDDKLDEVTNNVSYPGYEIDRITKPPMKKGFVQFKNGVVINESEKAQDFSLIFGEQLYWLIYSHFDKKEKLKKHGIKCLSLIFIDRVANYIDDNGIIKTAFAEQYNKVYKEVYKKEPSKEDIENIQGYYFAQTGKGDYTDSERSMNTNKELFDLILRDKEKLLSIDNPVEFIFSHSALGVGWDNPNVFNIATLNQSYSEIKKRQEIGRGLRICVNQDGRRIYDKPSVREGEEINLLTIIPNETYEAFAAQYQSEIVEIYGSTEAGAETRHTHKGEKKSEKKATRNKTLFESESFKKFWRKLARKTDYLVSFDDDVIIAKSIEALKTIKVEAPQVEVALHRISDIQDVYTTAENKGRQAGKGKVTFAPMDIIEEISENTGISYKSVFEILKGIDNYNEVAKNPPKFLQEAVTKIRQIELDELVRGLTYKLNGDKYDLNDLKEIIIRNTDRFQETPNRGIYDLMFWESDIEKEFAKEADTDSEVVCFLKLPEFYKIDTPIGPYNPDFGIVLKRKKIKSTDADEFYFVIETKGTNDINDHKALTLDEITKIKCAQKHFTALGIDAFFDYYAPVKEYKSFKKKADSKVLAADI
ncbi:MAG: DEAD/DEAH box helicase family protein [Melioribacteraceae bacterium]|nr:MAG: DEAD/DEAH box helicase family protein [Melioribacteraceae bacterium]